MYDVLQYLSSRVSLIFLFMSCRDSKYYSETFNKTENKCYDTYVSLPSLWDYFQVLNY